MLSVLPPNGGDEWGNFFLPHPLALQAQAVQSAVDANERAMPQTSSTAGSAHLWVTYTTGQDLPPTDAPSTPGPHLPPTDAPSTPGPHLPPTDAPSTPGPHLPPTDAPSTPGPHLPPTDAPSTPGPFRQHTPGPHVSPTEKTADYADESMPRVRRQHDDAEWLHTKRTAVVLRVRAG